MEDKIKIYHMEELCPECKRQREPGVRCPYCGARYEVRVDTVEDIIDKWDDQVLWDDLNKMK